VITLSRCPQAAVFRDPLRAAATGALPASLRADPRRRRPRAAEEGDQGLCRPQGAKYAKAVTKINDEEARCGQRYLNGLHRAGLAPAGVKFEKGSLSGAMGSGSRSPHDQFITLRRRLLTISSEKLLNGSSSLNRN
jgi:hypothetical protein